MTTTDNNQALSVPEDIYFEEDNQMLDFNQIQEITQTARKKIIGNRDKIISKIILTDKESERVDSYVKDIEKYIGKFAADAKDKFLYDCSKIENYIFFEVAQRFKEKNSKFYVQTNFGTQMIVVEWSGKNEA